MRAETTNRISTLGADIYQFATFYLNSELFGINILMVQEIQQPQETTPVPLAPDYILGLISLRGNIVPLIDLRRKLGMNDSQPLRNPYHLVVRTAAVTACFEVDDIGDVLDVPMAKFMPPPDSVKTVDAKFLEGVFPMSKQILSVLNVIEILEQS